MCAGDDRGFEVDEASMNAKWLIDEGVSPSHILTETASWEVLIPFPSQSPLSFPLLRMLDLPLICILQPHFYHHSYLFSFVIPFSISISSCIPLLTVC
jgi:hypothetical protein